VFSKQRDESYQITGRTAVCALGMLLTKLEGVLVVTSCKNEGGTV
jgi:hypothetical protein